MQKILYFENTYYQVYYEFNHFKDNAINYAEYGVRIIIKFKNQANVNEKIIFHLIADKYNASDNYNRKQIIKLLQGVLNLIKDIILNKDVTRKLNYLQKTMNKRDKARVCSFVSCYRQRTNLFGKLFKWKLVKTSYIKDLDKILSS